MMRVYSVMPNYTVAKSGSRNRVNSNNQTSSVGVSVPNDMPSSGVMISFTGEEKNINQFASYCPENKRYGYSAGGLGVVSQEAPANWRLREHADVRDFSPYHSYDNGDGGIKVVRMTKGADGRYKPAYPQENFIHAKQDESLDDIAKRIKLKKDEKLAYVRQLKPNDKGLSGFEELEDTGIRGSVVRPAVDGIGKSETIPYRVFRLKNLKDTVDEAVDKFKAKIYQDVQTPFRERFTSKVQAKYAEEMELAKAKDDVATALSVRETEIKRKNHPNQEFEPFIFKDEQKKVEAKIKQEVAEMLSGSEELKALYKQRLASKDVVEHIALIKAGAAPEVAERNSAYFIHTAGLARFESPYGNDNAYYSSSAQIEVDGKLQKINTDLAYADNNRAFVDALPKLNSKEHGEFNPAQVWLHDRPSFAVASYIADESNLGNEYYRGLKIHGTFHNPGRDYQGAQSNPFDFFRIVARKEDVEMLNKHPQFTKLSEIEAHWATASLEEQHYANQILRPFLAPFMDDYADTARDLRTYNISMIPVAGVQANPQNVSAGTVSMNYGKEMKSLETPDIAQFMTTKLAGIETKDVTNGSTPANLRLNDLTADFCQRGQLNGLTIAKEGFTPYEYKPVYDKEGKLVSDNIDEVLKAKKANTQWFLDSIGKAYDRGGQQAVTQMFFSPEQISGKGASVIGHLSKYKEGDMLFMGWGRPDPQKGYPSTFQAFLDFLKDPSVDKEIKQHAKLVVGAGVWDENARDFKWVKDIISQIESLDNGAYRGNACYVNGFFPNRLVGCATFSEFTSRFEPCGITPLESFASGTPTISTKTGGAPDFIAATRGYLTKNPYLRNPESLGLTAEDLKGKVGEELGNTIDGARMKANAAEVKECVAAAVTDFNTPAKEGKISKYAEMVRDCLQQKIDWHENSAYNGGKTANERYMNEIFEVDKGLAARNKEKMNRFVGKGFGIADNIVDAAKKLRNKWTKTVIGIGVAIAAVGTGAYVLVKRNHGKLSKLVKNDKTNNQDKKLDKAA